MVRVDLEDYQLGERIGVGTVGTIYEARHKSTGKQVAVKLLLPAVSSNSIVVSRFAREMMILEKLSHPNILEYYGGGEHDGQLFFVMELVRGETLKEMLAKTGPLPWRETVEVVRQLAAALQHAHNHGIIHRDLKPGNVFVSEEGILKLGDFGIARDTHEQDLTDPGLTVGTYAYMAPELVQGEEGITGKVDLYALGCLTFEILVGRPPYQGDNFVQIFEQHLHAQPPRPTACGVNCPPKLDELVATLLAKHPDDRPFNARWVQGFVGELVAGSTSKPIGGTSDRGAAEVTADARARLAARAMQAPGEARQVSWRQLGTLGLVTVVAILIGMLLGRWGTP